MEIDVINSLLKNNTFNSQLRDADSNTPLHICMNNFSKNICKSTQIAVLLLAHKANPNALNNEGWCPLHIAAKKGSLSALKFALSYNQSISLQQNNPLPPFNFFKKGGPHKWGLLHIASNIGHASMLEFLYF